MAYKLLLFVHRDILPACKRAIMAEELLRGKAAYSDIKSFTMEVAMSALDGVKILDFSTLLPGPYATMMLADLGAEVLRVGSKDKTDLVAVWPPMLEEAGVSAPWAWLSRNKKSIFLNLKKETAVQAVKELVKEYDIVVEQFRPGVMDKLGVGYEELRQANPRLIYCSLTGYGQTGPMAMKAGHDINYLSRAGVISAAGRAKEGPSLYNFQIADVASGAMNVVVSILAALHYRDVTGKGQYIDVSMTDGVIPFNSMDGACFLAGAPAPQRESQQLNGGEIYDFYRTKDGQYMSVGSLEPKFFAQLCIGMEHPEWADGKILKTDLNMVKETFKEKFLTKTRDEWTEIFQKLDACVEPVLSLEEAAADEHNNARQMWVDVPLPTAPGRTVRQMGCPIKLSDCPAEYRHAGYPAGFHTQEILKKLGYSDIDIKEMI